MVPGTWTVEFHPAFEQEFTALQAEVQDRLLSRAKIVAEDGPQAGRPAVDTLKGCKHPNMKELRFKAAGGEWRVAFAFDPERKAILLVAGDKTVGSEKKFYTWLLKKAEERFDEHLAMLTGGAP